MKEVVKTIEFNYEDRTREIMSGTKFRELLTEAMTKFCGDDNTYTITKCWYWLNDDFTDDMMDCHAIECVWSDGFDDIIDYDEIINRFNTRGVLPKKLKYIYNEVQYKNFHLDE